MSNDTPRTRKCAGCGYEWLHGEDGSHSCESNLLDQLSAVTKQHDALFAATARLKLAVELYESYLAANACGANTPPGVDAGALKDDIDSRTADLIETFDNVRLLMKATT